MPTKHLKQGCYDWRSEFLINFNITGLNLKESHVVTDYHGGQKPPKSCANLKFKSMKTVWATSKLRIYFCHCTLCLNRRTELTLKAESLWMVVRGHFWEAGGPRVRLVTEHWHIHSALNMSVCPSGGPTSFTFVISCSLTGIYVFYSSSIEMWDPSTCWLASVEVHHRSSHLGSFSKDWAFLIPWKTGEKFFPFKKVFILPQGNLFQHHQQLLWDWTLINL